MILSLSGLILGVAMVHGIDRSRLAQTPPPIKDFNIQQYVGGWYLQARLVSCSWSGSTFFTDFIVRFDLQDNGNVHLIDNFSHKNYSKYKYDVCVPDYILKPCPVAGVYKLKDPVGDVVSGELIMVATDYNDFSIEWGCTKRAVDGACPDYYVVVKTRDQRPSSTTLNTIATILGKLWNLSFKEMQRVTHDNACVKLPDNSAKANKPELFRKY